LFSFLSSRCLTAKVNAATLLPWDSSSLEFTLQLRVPPLWNRHVPEVTKLEASPLTVYICGWMELRNGAFVLSRSYTLSLGWMCGKALNETFEWTVTDPVTAEPWTREWPTAFISYSWFLTWQLLFHVIIQTASLRWKVYCYCWVGARHCLSNCGRWRALCPSPRRCVNMAQSGMIGESRRTREKKPLPVPFFHYKFYMGLT
jgi:hypothetical protein